MSVYRHDNEYAICPFCGEEHGDCSEWLTSESGIYTDCQSCGKQFVAWAEYSVMYHTKRPDPEAVAKIKAALDQRQPENETT